MNKLFAVASTDGLFVNQHFGHADRLFIYLASENGIEPIKTLNVTPYCSNNCSPEQTLNEIMSIISDCSYLLCMKIGPRPASKLKDAGIVPIETYGKIDDIINAIVSKNGLNEIYRFV